MTKTVLATAAALILPASAGDYLLGGSDSSAVSVGVEQSEQSTARKIFSTPARVLHVGDALPPMLSAGTQEFGLGGNVNFADDLKYNLDLSYGWFVKDNWQVGFRLGAQGTDSEIDFGLYLNTEYNFARNGSKWVPFVGGSIGWAQLNSDAFDSDSIALGLNVGIKYFLRENIALAFSIGADFKLNNTPNSDDINEQINIGTRFFF